MLNLMIEESKEKREVVVRGRGWKNHINRHRQLSQSSRQEYRGVTPSPPNSEKGESIFARISKVGQESNENTSRSSSRERRANNYSPTDFHQPKKASTNTIKSTLRLPPLSKEINTKIKHSPALLDTKIKALLQASPDTPTFFYDSHRHHPMPAAIRRYSKKSSE